MDVTWDPPTTPLGEPIDTLGRALAVAVGDAEKLLKRGDHGAAMAKLWPLRSRLSGYGRRLLLHATAEAHDWPNLITLTAEPVSIEELVFGVDARVRRADPVEARGLVDRYASRLSVPQMQVQELKMKIAVEEGLRKI
jgi:hypothetical protein